MKTAPDAPNNWTDDLVRFLCEQPGVGAWRIQVSDRTINRLMRNDLKGGREARLARCLADTLVTRGAQRQLGPPG